MYLDLIICYISMFMYKIYTSVQTCLHTHTETSTLLTFMDISIVWFYSSCVLSVCIHMPENVTLVEERTNKMDC